MRQVVLDTETTGISVRDGNRILEIGCVEVIDRKLTGNHYHVYINPQRESEEGALRVHGITTEFLNDKPLFEQVAQDFFDFINGAQLVIHNAPFDIGHMDAEFRRLAKKGGKDFGKTEDFCTVVDTLAMAKKMYPGAKNNLDALCRRFGIDNSHRTLHGALLDSEILADVYLLMTGGQSDLSLDASQDEGAINSETRRENTISNLKVIRASPEEIASHISFLEMMDKQNDGKTRQF
ncbi:DNA polymerase III subunit epsilon [Marinicellulosiphila megalodicopiae]|uniref:DNA polymerase III subunit epsilon n=1 Tax=Marinicellulosiphila megalodicopiae TaxID=2724896 RepID=UPI003BB18905